MTHSIIPRVQEVIMKFLQKFIFSTGLLLASNLFYANSMDVSKAQGPITRITVDNENFQDSGFTVCVNDTRYGEVCMWSRVDTRNYQNFLSIANTALIANKKVMIEANIVGSLNAITIYN